MATTPSSAESPREPLYPALEGFIEFATPEEVASVFAPLKASLTALKGPRAELGKKAHLAVERTEELIQYLFQVREKIDSSPRGPTR